MIFRDISRIAVIGFAITSIVIWYLLFITPVYTDSLVDYEASFNQIYGTILFMALPTVLFIILERILTKFTDFQLLVCCGFTAWVNLLLWVLNPHEIYKWYNGLTHGKK